MGLWYRGVLACAVVAMSLAAGGVASAQVEDEVWILNRTGGTNITVIGSASGDTPVVKRSLALGLLTPQDCVWSPNGRFFLVTSQGASAFSIIDTVNLTTVPIGGVESFATPAPPYGISFDPNGLRFYVSEGDDYGPPGAISGTSFQAFFLPANYPASGGIVLDETFDTAGASHAGATAGATIDNVVTPAGFTPNATDNNITYHTKSGFPFAAAAGRDTAGPDTDLTVQSGIQVVPAILAADVPVFEGRTNSGILASATVAGTTHLGIPGNRAFNDLGEGPDTNFDIHSGHLMAIDPLNRWVAMVVGADYLENDAAAEVPTADIERALLDIHPITDMSVSETFFDSGTSPSSPPIGPNDPLDQEVIAIAVHPSGNFIYCCARDVTNSGAGNPGGVIRLIRIPGTYSAAGGAVADAIDVGGTNFVATGVAGTATAGLLPTGIAFTRDGSRGYVILDNGAGRGFVQTFRCHLTALPPPAVPVGADSREIGEIVNGSLSAPVEIGNKPSAICTRPIAVGVADPPVNTGEQEKSHKCFIGELSEAQRTGPTALAPLASALALAVLLAGLLANRPR